MRVLLTISMLLWGAGDLPAYHLYLRNKVIVKDFPLRLREVGRLEGHTSADMPHKVVLSQAQGPVYLSAADFQKALAGGPEKAERIFGGGVWIVPLSRSLAAPAIKARIEQEIEKRVDGKSFLQNHEIRVDETASLSLPLEENSLVFRLPGALASLSHGRRVLAVDMLPPGGSGLILHRQQVSLTIFRKIRLAVASRALSPGERLTANDFRYVEKMLDGDDRAYATDKLIGRRVMQPVREGETLLRSVVQISPPVRRGQQLTLVVQKQGLVLKAKSVALKDAQPGDKIPLRVLLPGGQKSRHLEGRIVDENHAIME